MMDLALNLFCPSAEARFRARSRFCPEAPLIRFALLHLLPDPSHVQPPLLSHYMKLDDQIVRFILAQPGTDPRLSVCCRLADCASSSDAAAVNRETVTALGRLAAWVWETRQPLRLYFQGSDCAAKRQAAELTSRRLGARLLIADLAAALDAGRDFRQMLKLIFREAWLQGAVLYLDGVDALRREGYLTAFHTFLEVLEEDAGITILSGVPPWIPVQRGVRGVLTVRFDVLEREQAREHWRRELEGAGVTPAAEMLDLLADRFRLNSEQIADAAAGAVSRGRWRAAAHAGAGEDENLQLTLDDLCASARSETGHGLSGLARKIQPRHTWTDIVLPPDQIEQLREVCDKAKHWTTVFDVWGFGRKLSLGKGLNVLFSGPPGTGKTMAAEVIASELRLDLYKIDLSRVVSKYIGDTERNLDRIFTAAENSNAILFFDEADALFGKRSEVKDSHDRYANIEIGYLLQKRERNEAIAILATNVKHHMDEAFVRRMQAIVEFPFPEEAERRRVWQVAFPREAPLDADVDFNALAQAVRLAGGNIKNIARCAAFYAAADGGTIRLPHLIKASRREYQKLGRTWDEAQACTPGQSAAERH